MKKLTLLFSLIIMLQGCSALSSLIPDTGGPKVNTAVNFQKGDNRASVVDQTTKGKGNVAHSNQQVLSGVENATINQGASVWQLVTILGIIILVFGAICAGLLFLLGLAIEKPKIFGSKIKN